MLELLLPIVIVHIIGQLVVHTRFAERKSIEFAFSAPSDSDKDGHENRRDSSKRNSRRPDPWANRRPSDRKGNRAENQDDSLRGADRRAVSTSDTQPANGRLANDRTFRRSDRGSSQGVGTQSDWLDGASDGLGDSNEGLRWKPVETKVFAGGIGKGDGPGQLSSPWGVAVASDGGVFVADSGNHHVVYVPESGEVEEVGIVAGMSGRGISNDKLNCPRGVASAFDGGLFVSDAANHRVMHWEGTSTSTQGCVVAGGFFIGSSNDQLNSPSGVAPAFDGGVFVADTQNHRVVHWPRGAQSGIVVAGGRGRGDGPRQLSYPWGVAHDGAGGVFVADTLNHRVMHWLGGASSGAVVAGGKGQGSGVRRLNSPKGIAVDKDGGLYISDTFNHRVVYSWRGAHIHVTVLGGNGQGSGPEQLDFPVGVAVDDNGGLYVSDTENHRVLHARLDPDTFPRKDAIRAEAAEEARLAQLSAGGQGVASMAMSAFGRGATEQFVKSVSATTTSAKEWMNSNAPNAGIFSGAVLGGLIAGPIGAVAGGLIAESMSRKEEEEELQEAMRNQGYGERTDSAPRSRVRQSSDGPREPNYGSAFGSNAARSRSTGTRQPKSRGADAQDPRVAQVRRQETHQATQDTQTPSSTSSSDEASLPAQKAGQEDNEDETQEDVDEVD
eukprot:gnl/MRDRNA2_/MRDRNA2_109401_c0_seq1.p1 gnl/MRDRNA2_/MRDRNA2_109401_c0~~gnl/MRDRNA2_/MRDRNA2_109401_c0_seq1.p1  ORF type:complete len:667 (+),score=131.47 gnl/MRDRNA2_/MRDRNA2_109401_c0_seq1:19-2019(+)